MKKFYNLIKNVVKKPKDCIDIVNKNLPTLTKTEKEKLISQLIKSLLT